MNVFETLLEEVLEERVLKVKHVPKAKLAKLKKYRVKNKIKLKKRLKKYRMKIKLKPKKKGYSYGFDGKLKKIVRRKGVRKHH